MIQFSVEVDWLSNGVRREIPLDEYRRFTSEQLGVTSPGNVYATTPSGERFQLSERDARYLRLGALQSYFGAAASLAEAGAR